MFHCVDCKKHFQSITFYLTHTKNYHSHDPFFKYFCGLNGCPDVNVTFRGFKSHIFRHEELHSHKKKV